MSEGAIEPKKQYTLKNGPLLAWMSGIMVALMSPCKASSVFFLIMHHQYLKKGCISVFGDILSHQVCLCDQKWREEGKHLPILHLHWNSWVVERWKKEDEVGCFHSKGSSRHLGFRSRTSPYLLSKYVELCIRVVFLANGIGISEPMMLDIELLRHYKSVALREV